MFQAIVYVNIPENYIQPIVSVMNQTCPKEICSIFADTPPLNLSFKIQIVTNQTSSKLDDLCEAPHLFIYFFTCNDKNDFIKNVKNNYLEYSKANKRDYVPVMPIYINNSKNAKIKSKIFLQNSIISFLQPELPNLQTINIKANGFASKSGFERLWPSIVGQIVQSVTSRINSIRAAILKQKISYNTFRQLIRLCTMYDQVSCFDKCFEVINNVERIIGVNKKMFTFIDPKALTYRFDFCVGADNVEAKVFAEDPTEYDLRFIFFKRRIQTLLCIAKNNEAISSAFNFFISMSNRVKEEKNITEYMYSMWVAQALGDIANQCAKEKEMNNSIYISQYASILEWYIKALPNARKSFIERSRRVSFIDNKDPLRIVQEEDNFYEKFGKVGDFMILENILSKNERFNAEITRNLLSLISYYTGAGYTRCAAVAMSKMRYFSQNDDDQYTLSAIITIIKKGYSHIIPIITENMIQRIPFDDRLYACCKIISDVQSKHREVAVNYLSNMLTKTEPNQTFRTSFNLPIKLSILSNQEDLESTSGSESEDIDNSIESIDEGKPSYNAPLFIQNEKVSIRLKVKCGFPGHLKCNRLLVGFLNCYIIRIAYLECTNVDIYDGAIITVSNSFAKAGSYAIYNLKLICGQDQVLNVILPSSVEFIHIHPPPLPFDFSIEVPNLLLPRRWQLARLNIKVVRDVESLVLKVFGISYRTAILLLKNNEKRTPEKGLIYTNIPSGEHEINLPIFPQTNSSGMLKIEADANDQTVIREIHFKVSEFLEFKLQFRKETKSAQLSAFLKSQSDLIITAVDFYEKDASSKIKSKNIGLPLKVGLSQSSALFFLEGEPDVARIWIKQNEMKEFAIRLNVEAFDEEAMAKNDDLVEISPLTTLCPKDFSI